MTSPETVPAMLMKWSKEDPDKPAFIFRGTGSGNSRLVLTRFQVLQLASAFACHVAEAGVNPGDVVCNTLPNSPERVISDLGLMMAGVVALNGMVFLGDGSDLAKCFQRGDVVALVVNPHQPKNALSVLEDRITIKGDTVTCKEAPRLRRLFLVDCGGGAEARPWLDTLRVSPAKFQSRVRSEDVAFVFTTSGTSGFSKLVPRTHKQFVDIGRTFYEDVMEGTPTDLHFNDRSVGWLGGAVYTYVGAGATRVIVDCTTVQRDPLAFSWECIISEKCEIACLVPPHISASLAKPDMWKESGHHIRTFITGGMPVSKAQASLVTAGMADQLIITYASTEGGFMCFNKVTTDNINTYEDGDNGVAVKGYTLKLVPDKGSEEIAPINVGKSGELYVKGPQMFTGYMGSSVAETKEMFSDDGWMKTSDVAYYNTKGHIHVVCRKSNAIMHGAYIIYPGWLEKKLEKCPGVLSVMIVPVPDPKMYQEMCACVVPKDGVKLQEEDVRTFADSLYGTHANAEYKQVPRYYVFFDQFPLTAAGTKPDRKKIFVTALEKLNLAGSLI